MHTSTHIQGSGSRCARLVLLVAVTLVGGLALTLVYLATGSAAATRVKSAPSMTYSWPVKPFDRPHPVRGSFGDPRTVFHAPPTLDGLLTGHGSFGFHQGVDISAPNGTSVYPVLSGHVTRVSGEWVRVDSGDGRVFEYWHIHPQVKPGTRVEAHTTVLGHIMRPAEHVHLTEYYRGRVVNPLAAGHLTPYEDTTSPQVTAISFRKTATGGELLPSFLRGRVRMVVAAEDTPTLAVPRNWNGLPVTPALITWRVEQAKGKVALAERIATDFRESVPNNDAFWQHYARGTYQNMAVFGPHYSFRQRGAYLFNLTPAPFDTRLLRDGVYDLVVTATDIRGNSGSLSIRFTVHNRPGWIGS